MTDDEIYQGVAHGNRGALDELYSSSKEHVARICAFFLGEDEGMPGAVVGVYGRALAALGTGKKPGMPLNELARWTLRSML